MTFYEEYKKLFDKMKPCPLCGSTEKKLSVDITSGKLDIECQNCKTVFAFNSIEHMITAWEYRT